ncbi:MAG: NAD(+) synthase [Gemmataceae bacterium]|nr:NAD(+) synthase [Gemmataceae bacterium]
MPYHGFVRVGAAVPALRVADTAYNAERILALLARAQAEQVAVLVFPELCLTGYTCADLFHQSALQKGALQALAHVVREGRKVFSGLAVVGLPVSIDEQLFNCAAVFHGGRVLGMVPKSFIPNYKEFYEARWFAAAANVRSRRLAFDGDVVPFGIDLLFDAADVEGLLVGVEICEDLWVPIPPSSLQALHGASVLLNLSASNEVIGKSQYRRQLVVGQSGRCMAAYAYSSCGVWESTTDVVFGGHALIAENGTLLGQTPRFQRDERLLLADVDLDRLRADRVRTNSFAAPSPLPLSPWGERGRGEGDGTAGQGFQRIPFLLNRPDPPPRLARVVDAHPFVPRGQEQLYERCQEIFSTQMAGLAKRLDHIGRPEVTIGVSGGLDSTLALLVACRTFDLLGEPRTKIRAFTMPGFGTTSRTLANAHALMKELRVSPREVDIRLLCLEEMRALGHRPFGIDLDGLDVEGLTERLRGVPKDKRNDLVFENVQARMRTSILMNAGFVVGTGDVSELALGWATYNGDHMSMYNPNVSIPKTLVKFLVDWAARNEFDGEARRILLDIVATEISPELLPPGEDGQAVQSTEGAIGPYELHDFFLFHLQRYGASPDKIVYLAGHAQFHKSYTAEEVRRWLRVFLKRFFANQFKRSCLPDGPKVGSVSLSPRGDWRMPSDGRADLWLQWLTDEEAAVEQEAGVKRNDER